jgi:hypothetical protein
MKNAIVKYKQAASILSILGSLLNLPVGPKKWSLSKKEHLGMMGLSTGLKPNTIKEALLL